MFKEQPVKSQFVEVTVIVVPAVTCSFFSPTQTAGWTATSCARIRWRLSARRTPNWPMTVQHRAPHLSLWVLQRVGSGFWDSIPAICTQSFTHTHTRYSLCSYNQYHCFTQVPTVATKALQYVRVLTLTYSKYGMKCATWWLRNFKPYANLETFTLL